MKWRLLLQPDLPGYRQMAIDEALYVSLESHSVPVLRFYTWESPTLSLGYFQDYKRVVSEPFCVHNNICVVRRPTGGRAVLHQFEITYAVVAPLEDEFKNLSLRETYQLISRALNLALQHLGIIESSISIETSNPRERQAPQCFVNTSPFEITYDSRKAIGSAQKRSRDRFLQHGSILLDFDPYLQQGCILHPDPEIVNKIAPLNPRLGHPVSFQEGAAVFTQAFREVFEVEIENSTLLPRELHLLEELERKYRSDEWTKSGCR